MIPFTLPLVSAVGSVYTLAGLTGFATDKDTTNSLYEAKFVFRVVTNGTVDLLRNINSDTIPDETYVTPPGGSLYVRCTQVSGTALNVGDTLSTWHNLTSERTFGLQISTSGGPDLISAELDFDLATDSGGTNIVASASSIDIEVGQQV